MCVKSVCKNFLYVLISSFVLFSVGAFSSLSDCYVGSSCGSDAALFSVSDYSNAHAAFNVSVSGYLRVCCAGSGISSSYVGGYQSAVVVRLENLTNSHVERPDFSNYAYPVYLSALDDQYEVLCSYGSSCGPGYVAVVSIENDTNSHIGNESAYSNKVCCIVQLKEFNDSLVLWDSYEDSVADLAAPVTFFANYSSSEGLISGAECNITFDEYDFGPFVMNESVDYYYYTRTGGFLVAGVHDWNVSCSKYSHATLISYDNVTVQDIGGPGYTIPEFSIRGTIVAVLIIVAASLLILKKHP